MPRCAKRTGSQLEPPRLGAADRVDQGFGGPRDLLKTLPIRFVWHFPRLKRVCRNCVVDREIFDDKRLPFVAPFLEQAKIGPDLHEFGLQQHASPQAIVDGAGFRMVVDGIPAQFTYGNGQAALGIFNVRDAVLITTYREAGYARSGIFQQLYQPRFHVSSVRSLASVRASSFGHLRPYNIDHQRVVLALELEPRFNRIDAQSFGNFAERFIKE